MNHPDSGTRRPAPAAPVASGETTGVPSSASRSSAAVWTAHAACAWTFVFGAVSFYWAAGGTLGTGRLAKSVRELGLVRDPTFITEVWITGILKVLAGLLALALVRPWGRRLPRRPLRAAVWAAGGLLILYGGSGLVQAALIEAGVIDVPASMGEAAVRWYLVLWEPWWLLGGFLFAAAAWSTRQRQA